MPTQHFIVFNSWIARMRFHDIPFCCFNFYLYSSLICSWILRFGNLQVLLCQWWRFYSIFENPQCETLSLSWPKRCVQCTSERFVLLFSSFPFYLKYLLFLYFSAISLVMSWDECSSSIIAYRKFCKGPPEKILRALPRSDQQGTISPLCWLFNFDILMSITYIRLFVA